MLLLLLLLGVRVAVCDSRVDYRVAYLNPDTGEFGGNITVSATPPWFLKFDFPSPATQIKHTAGPVEVNHYQDGTHLASLRPGTAQDSVTVSFIATCGVVPSPWDEVLIAPPTLFFGSSIASATPQLLAANVSFFVAPKDDNLPREAYGIFARSSAQLVQLKADDVSETRMNLSEADRASLEADGTYLVGTQLSLIIYSTVFLIGASSYAFGSLLRLKHRKRFRSEKLRRARNVQGYSQIL